MLNPNLLEHAVRMTTMTTAASYGKISDEELELASMDDVATAAEPAPAHGAASSAAARDAGDASDALAPFRHRDYRLLWLTNVCEFCGRALSSLALSVWLYERTRSNLALGALGLVSLCVQLPMIPVGGVLADEFDRRRLVSGAQAAAAASCALAAPLVGAARFTPPMAYARARARATAGVSRTPRR